jgi:hypothetical protein
MPFKTRGVIWKPVKFVIDWEKKRVSISALKYAAVEIGKRE